MMASAYQPELLRQIVGAASRNRAAGNLVLVFGSDEEADAVRRHGGWTGKTMRMFEVRNSHLEAFYLLGHYS